MSAKPLGLVRRPAFKVDQNAKPLAAIPTVDYLPYVSVPPNTLITSPGLDTPFLYHLGTIRGLEPRVSTPTADVGISRIDQYHNYRLDTYTPTDPPWFAKNRLLRVPRVVVVEADFLGGDVESRPPFLPFIADAARTANASVLVMAEIPSVNRLLSWAPPRLSRIAVMGTLVPGFDDLIDPRVYFGGDILYVACGVWPYFSGYFVGSSAIPIPGGDVYDVGTHGFKITIDRAGIAAARHAFPAMVARCNRFAGVFVYEPMPLLGEDTLVPDDPILADFEAAYPSSALWSDHTAELPWTRQEIAPGASHNSGTAAAAYGAAISAAIAKFWP